MQGWLMLVIFLLGWIGFFLWARRQQKLSLVISIGGGFLVGCLVLIAVASAFFPREDDNNTTSPDKSTLSSAQQANNTTPISESTIANPMQPEHQTFQIKPESIVMFPKSNIACLTKDALQQTLEHGLKGEATKMTSQFISSGNPDAECIMLDSNKRYKVISSEYNDPDHPEFGILEIVGAEKKIAAKGAFVVVLDNALVTIVK